MRSVSMAAHVVAMVTILAVVNDLPLLTEAHSGGVDYTDEEIRHFYGVHSQVASLFPTMKLRPDEIAFFYTSGFQKQREATRRRKRQAKTRGLYSHPFLRRRKEIRELNLREWKTMTGVSLKNFVQKKVFLVLNNRHVSFSFAKYRNCLPLTCIFPPFLVFLFYFLF